MKKTNHHSDLSLRPGANKTTTRLKPPPPADTPLVVTRTGKPKALPLKPAFSMLQSTAAELFQGQRSPKKQRKLQKLDQWIEVRIVDGKTITTLYPSNEKLIKRGQRLVPPPEYVYRRFHFPGGVPDEYAWVSDDPEQRKRGGSGIQRMTIETWLDLIKRERDRADGHLGPTGVGNLPRPAESGECSCRMCTENGRLLNSFGHTD